MEKILIHSCCAPCFIAPYYNLKERFEITGFWFNHNIHPIQEYYRRRDTFREFTNNEGIRLIEKDEYGLKTFLQNVVFREDSRCYQCYYERLNYTAIIAKKGKFDYFTSSLLYSKFQKHNLIIEIAESVAKKHSVKFYYQDFRELWKQGIELSKEHNMYRQQYCGCIYSEMDRFAEKKVLTQ
ncbi:MAG: epoxyqueuosine reductase QueH [Candidatus Cloacimonetes bacterium]|jgi:hypothetical protein|nr:epoxyqueuosine reductase QueH [Candidatus Cloacimonadota bacterium]MDD4156991.1 epoxyqueuosine reductase QueH [Candidatus Cloacimonadota bacterium]